jgi:hypothetical protein
MTGGPHVTDPTARRQEPPPPDENGDGEDHPLGTLFLLMIFLTALAGMWGAMYLTLLSR